MVPFLVFAINIYKIGLPFTQTLPRDQRRGLLIAFSNKHPALDHQSVCLFSQIWLYLIKYLLQLELGRTCSTDSDLTIERLFSNSLSIEPAQTVTQWP